MTEIQDFKESQKDSLEINETLNNNTNNHHHHHHHFPVPRRHRACCDGTLSPPVSTDNSSPFRESNANGSPDSELSGNSYLYYFM